MRRWFVFAVLSVAVVLVLCAIREIPDIPVLEACGNVLAGEASMYLLDGQEEYAIVTELMGGQPYLNGSYDESGDAVTDQAVMAQIENEQESDVSLRESTPVLGDVESDSQTVMQQSSTASASVRKSNVLVDHLRESLDVNYLWKNFYIVDSTTSVTKKNFDVKKLLEKDLTMKKKKGKKQILIYHTHGASESFKDSKANTVEDSVVGVGTELAKELEKKGYGVYHDTTRYDLIDGQLDRSLAYNKSLEGIQKIRSENPDIKVMIDLHRDSVGKGKHTYTTIQNKKTAMVMFFNGMSRTRSGEISYLYNPNLQGNLAFSLQLKCKAMEYYDGFTKPIYLKGYRYNLHLLPRSLLIELGNENNTVAEAKNAVSPLADILDKVLSGSG